MVPFVVACAVLSVASLHGLEQKGAPGHLLRDPGDPVSLVLDDGTAEDDGGGGVPFIIINQFSPAEFPLELDEVQVLWIRDPLVSLGDPFWLFLYEDEDGDLLNGTEHRATFEGTVDALDGVSFTTVSFPPVHFDGPGDVLVAVGLDVVAGSWAARDLSPPSQLRSWISAWGGEMPPPLPNGDTTGVSQDTNWLIRGFGTVLDVPVTLQSVGVE